MPYQGGYDYTVMMTYTDHEYEKQRRKTVAVKCKFSLVLSWYNNTHIERGVGCEKIDTQIDGSTT